MPLPFRRRTLLPAPVPVSTGKRRRPCRSVFRLYASHSRRGSCRTASAVHHRSQTVDADESGFEHGHQFFALFLHVTFEIGFHLGVSLEQAP